MVRNEDILKDILLKMSYDTSKTLNENIEEQMGEKPWMTPRGMSYSQNLKSQQLKPLSKEDRHLLMDIAAFGVLTIPLVGPALSLGIELANAGMYYAEGDKYGAGFALAFALIPMGELVAKIPAVKKLGRDGLAGLIKKARRGGKLTKAETEVVEQISKNEKWFKINSARQATKMFVKSKLQKATLEDIVFAVYKFSKRNPKKFNLVKMGLQIGGVWYSYDKLAKMYGIEKKQPELSSSEPMNDEVQTVTDFDKVWDYKKDGDKYYTKKKGTDKWILTSGKVKDSIKTKIFSGKESSHKLTPQLKKIEQDYLKDKEKINDIVASQLTSRVTMDNMNQVQDELSAYLDL